MMACALRLSFFPLILCFVFIKSNGQNETSSYCAPTFCGEQSVSYPFWVKNNNSNSITDHGQYHCGDERLGLDCLPSSTSPAGHDLFLQISDEYFHVRSMDSKSVTLVDPAVISNSSCPMARRNLTLDEHYLPLDYNNDLDANLTFYFNCTRPLRFPNNTTLPIHGAGCLSSGGNLSYVYLKITDERYYDSNWFEICDQKVVTAVNRGGLEGAPATTPPDLGISFGLFMKEGFVLEWRPDQECSSCELSMGFCGFKNGTKEFLCFCSDGPIKPHLCQAKEHKPNVGLKIGVGLGASAFCGFVICLAYILYSILGSKTKEDRNLEALVRQYGSLAPQRYSYSGIKKITKSFRDELGRGGYGTVYKGKLLDGRLVAVKILKIAEGNGEEFINEVLSIGRTSHVNVVTLLGFCLEGKRRALVYEYMPNGSLEKYIHSDENSAVCFNQLGLNKLYQISLGVARGLEYLHRGCNTRILHFDIKPHNILLDADFNPKISDFGLAKQYTKEESIMSILGARGTIGYIAPELVSRSFGVVSYKSDVYSYGMMILEIVGRRKNVNLETSHASEIYFPHWAYQHLVIEKDLRLKGVASMEEDEIAQKIILVGLWCIQSDPSQRPTMSKVIEMLEGDSQAIAIPPKPFFGSPSTTPGTSPATTIVVVS